MVTAPEGAHCLKLKSSVWPDLPPQQQHTLSSLSLAGHTLRGLALPVAIPDTAPPGSCHQSNLAAEPLTSSLCCPCVKVCIAPGIQQTACPATGMHPPMLPD